LNRNLTAAKSQTEVDELLANAEMEAGLLTTSLAKILADIIKGAGITVDATDKFRKKSNAELLAEGLQAAIAEDIEGVKSMAQTASDAAKARIKKEEAANAKAMFEKTKNAARDAAKEIAKLKAKKSFLEQRTMRAKTDEEKVKIDKDINDLTSKIKELEEAQAENKKRAARLEEEGSNAGFAAELAERITQTRTSEVSLRTDLST